MRIREQIGTCLGALGTVSSSAGTGKEGMREASAAHALIHRAWHWARCLGSGFWLGILACILGLVPQVNAAVRDTFTDSSFQYTVLSEEGHTGTVLVAKQSNSTPSGDVTIPSSINKGGITYTVTTIGFQAFYDCRSLESIEIPASVTSIGSQAFQNCKSLKSIEIPSSVTTIGSSAFSGCTSLESIIFGEPSKLTTIEHHAFYNCSSLKSITIPSSVTRIEDFAFYNCTSLKNIEIPSSVTTIESDTFNGCRSLTSIIIPSSVTTIGYAVFNGCTSLTSITIPASVTMIENRAFYDCRSLKSIEIPSSVTTIGASAFSGCNALADIEIPWSVTTIGSQAFQNCKSLKSIEIPSSVTTIGEYAFNGCSGLTEITVAVANSNYCSVAGVLFSKDKTLLHSYPAGKTGVYTIPASVTTIGKGAFDNCSALESISIPASVTTIGNSAFRNCSGLTSITIPNSVTTIGNYAFESCTNLKNIMFEEPSKLTTIGNYAFSRCSGLTSITIPASVTTIGNVAFYNCSVLSRVYYCGDMPAVGTSIYSGTPTELTSYYLSGKSGWSGGSFADRTLVCSAAEGDDFEVGGLKYTVLGIPCTVSVAKGPTAPTGVLSIPASVENAGVTYTVTTIGASAFFNCSGLTSITIPNSVTTIGASAFFNCSGLTSITIPASVITIGTSAFNGCSGLTEITVDAANSHYSSVAGVLFNKDNTLLLTYPAGKTGVYTIPASVITIESGAFCNCGALVEVTIPVNVTTMGNQVFQNCTSLKVVHFLADVDAIGESTFNNCIALEKIEIPNGVSTIGSSAFQSCTSLKSVIIPEGVVTIGANAFNECTSLTSADIPASVTTIGDAAFNRCPSLSAAYFRGNAPSANDDIFHGHAAQMICYRQKGTTGWNNPSWIGYTWVEYESDGILLVIQPQAQTLLLGDDVELSVKALSGSPLTYQWYKDGTALPGKTQDMLSIPDATASDTGNYKVVVSISSTVNEASNEVRVSVSEYTPEEDFDYEINDGKVTITGYHGIGEAVSIPPTIGGYPVTQIGDRVFDALDWITSVVFPEGVTTIGDYVFNGCKGLASVVFPYSLTTLGNYVFNGCNFIESVVIPGRVTTMGERVFSSCSSLMGVYYGGDLPSSVGDDIYAETFPGLKSYYVEGARGWTATFAGQPTALWAKDGAPVITMQPQGKTIFIRESAEFRILAVGTPTLSYQWSHNDVDIPGATDSTYAIANAKVSDAGTYKHIVINN